MFRSLASRVAPAVRSAAVARPAAAAAVRPISTRSLIRAAPSFSQAEVAYARASSSNGEPTEEDYNESRNLLLSAAGSLAVIGYAFYVVAGEPAHAAAHPHYQPPYAFVKRNMETGAGWWPGKHCMFFEFNCFAQTYAEADRMLAELEKEEESAAYTKRR